MPGYQKQRIVQRDTVVGWGQLRLPTSGGTSILYDVLLVKESLTLVDSVFLGGNPAPGTLISAFGLTQGQTHVQNSYNFYAAGFERPLLIIEMSDNWQTALTSFHAGAGLATFGLPNDEENDQAKVFPNPINAAQVLHITTANASINAQLIVVDALGKEICSEQLESTTNGHFTWNVPAHLPKGIYFYTLLHSGTGQSTVGKLLVN